VAVPFQTDLLSDGNLRPIRDQIKQNILYRRTNVIILQSKDSLGTNDRSFGDAVIVEALLPAHGVGQQDDRISTCRGPLPGKAGARHNGAGRAVIAARMEWVEPGEAGDESECRGKIGRSARVGTRVKHSTDKEGAEKKGRLQGKDLTVSIDPTRVLYPSSASARVG
jgi:hypothetical protein